ncbi:tail assembly chaperone (endogenous virus) [Propionibacterium phage PAD20]|uniref:Gp12 n=1 Tax=Propionibacterium phage PAD20 TaxID=504501 RepID=F4MIF8_9CAUD|nr:tail assembly chaperone [Propionibacterium phage PAD20]ACX30807.1 Gp12 [Propionibacterium phage PAD20]
MSDTGYTLKIGDRSWVLADAEETAQAVPARVCRAAKIAQSGESADFAQVEVMFSMLEAAAPVDAVEALEGLPMVRVAEIFREWMEYKPDGKGASLGE